ncbi:GNAT family N-acetyltransferase [Nonomuraea phyllanthi]|uniref:GNAT family N-acetyltransferase n=1 Tax=Nonomuraea phyllanthi TaxID=2219224 RepID=A0A5C4WES9_9ACTN|nr:GNAT family protein [Nonomuraea phyllanthi]KAB8193520.1 GNAT family N-acetyltransferase [Nonomuraea phyllanthi]QFY12262.1 GNAT family N-acetyltransferase [Nonomuraea phyllanthi]
MTAKLPSPVVLENDAVRLEPLSLDHVPDLFAAAGGDDDVWRWMPVATPASEAELAKVAARLISDDVHVPFAVVAGGRAVGWTTYADVPGFDESVEIGWTWYGRAMWRTAVNTACKVLLIDHAFGLGHNRVLLKTDCLNLRSQNAIKRIGGVHEGTLRRHRRRPDGTWRDTVYFGILDDEWPAHRSRLTSPRAQLPGPAGA